MTNFSNIYQVDAFTKQPFKGNPAGIMLVDENFSSEYMQNIAAEMNLAETAFIIAMGDKFKIRYFTPTKEVPICGHATLAGAHILYELGIVTIDKTIHFEADGGNLKVYKHKDSLVMDFPKFDLKKIETPTNFKNSVGFEPLEVYSSDYGWIIGIAKTQDEIIKAEPNLALISQNGMGHLMITSEGDSEELDFVSRCFAPVSGIDEDPVTGSAHCALTPLWAKRLKKNKLKAKQVSKRTGDLQVELIDDRVKIIGQAITIMKIELMVKG